MPWRTLTWFAVVFAMFALVPLVGELFGALAGYALILAAVALGGWRVDRLLGPQWRGLQDYRQGF